MNPHTADTPDEAELAMYTGEGGVQRAEPEPSFTHAGSVRRALLSNVVTVPTLGVIGLASVAVLARVLTGLDWALYGLVLALISSLSLGTDLGTRTGTRLFYPEAYRRQGRRGVWRICALVVGMRLGILVLAVLMLAWFRPFLLDKYPLLEAREWLLVPVAGIVACQGVAGACECAIQAFFRHGWANGALVFFRFTETVLVVLGALWVGGVGGIVGGMLVAAAMYSVILLVVMGRLPLEKKDRPAPIPRFAARFVRTSVASLYGRVVSFISSPRCHLLVFAAFVSPELLAQITFAVVLCERVSNLAFAPLRGVVLPYLAQLRHTQPEKFPARARLTSKLLLVPGLMLCAAAIALAPGIVALLGGTSFDEATLFLVLYLPVVLLGQAVLQFVHSAALVMELNRWYVVYRSFLLIPPVVGFVALVFGSSVVGVAAFGVAYLIVHAAGLPAMCYRLGVPTPWQTVVKYAAVCAGVLLGGWLLLYPISPWLHGGVVCLGIALLPLVLRPFDRADAQTLRGTGSGTARLEKLIYRLCSADEPDPPATTPRKPEGGSYR